MPAKLKDKSFSEDVRDVTLVPSVDGEGSPAMFDLTPLQARDLAKLLTQAAKRAEEVCQPIPNVAIFFHENWLQVVVSDMREEKNLAGARRE